MPRPAPIDPRASNFLRVENPLHTATSCDTNIEDYIGSGTSSTGGLSPGAFLPTPEPTSEDEDYERGEAEDSDGEMGRPRPPIARGRSGTPLLSGDEDDAAQRNGSEARNSRGSLEYTTGGRRSPSPDGQAGQSSPFLRNDSESRSRPTFSRRSTMRSVSPAQHAHDIARTKYIYASFVLILILVSFVVQTELSNYIQKDLGWNKAYCMLYFTHGSWVILWPVQLLILRLQRLDVPWRVFWRRHLALLRSTAMMVQSQTVDVDMSGLLRRGMVESPVWYMAKMTAFITCALTIAGASWYIAVDMTTPSDLTVIYNCSAFFAYVFAVPLLKEPLRLDKSIAVGVAILGVLFVAYGDSKSGDPTKSDPGAASRLFGNVIIGIGSVLYGLYEVLYKRFACPPAGVSPGRGTIFANTFGSCVGAFTLLVLWIPLPLLHITGIEPFVLPTGQTAWLLFLSVLANATFAGSFLVLISLTGPVFSSVASMLTIFVVAVTDWMLTGEPIAAGALAGGLLILLAFGMLSWSTWREMGEEADKKEFEPVSSDEDGSGSERDA
jgi:drug/metabolite transporter (DMT)-like permease